MPNLLHGLWHIKISTNNTTRWEERPKWGGQEQSENDSGWQMANGTWVMLMMMMRWWVVFGGHWWWWSKNLINIWTEWDRRHTATTIPRLLCLESATTGHEINKIDRMVRPVWGGGFENWCKSKISEKLQWLSPCYYRHHLIQGATQSNPNHGWVDVGGSGADTDGHTVPKSKPLTKSISAVPCGQPAANRPANMQQRQFVTTLLKVCTTTANLGVNGGSWMGVDKLGA